MSNHVDFDDYTENYNELLQRDTRFFSSDEEYFAKYKVVILSDHAARPVRHLLEYGCGIGRNISFLRHAFPNARIIGSDISQVSLEQARRDHPGIEFLKEDDGDGPAGKFDLIFVAGVFHHIPLSQRAAIAGTLFDRLVPGGELFVFEHNPLNPLTRRIVNTCPYDQDAVLLKPTELGILLREAGFAQERLSYCLFVPPRMKILTIIEKGLGWLPLGGQYWIQAKRAN